MGDAPDSPSPKRRLLSAILNALLFLGGVWIFVYLIRTSGMTWAMLEEIGWRSLALLFFISFAVIAIDTVAWYYALRHAVRPKGIPLFGLRIAGDSLTNAVPGGVVLGETYKAVKLKEWYKITLRDNALVLLLVKFGLGISQAVFVLIGLAFCYPLIRDRSVELFGFAGAHYLVLVLTLGMGLMLFFTVVIMGRGGSLGGLFRLMHKIPIGALRRWLSRNEERAEKFDQNCQEVLRNHRRNLLLTFLYLFLGWVVYVGESYVLLDAMGLNPTWRSAFAMESVGSLFRLIFFMVPSGIGGQDASFFALFKLYHYPLESAGVFILVKRFKEVIWIGLGILLILFYRIRRSGV